MRRRSWRTLTFLLCGAALASILAGPPGAAGQQDPKKDPGQKEPQKQGPPFGGKGGFGKGGPFAQERKLVAKFDKDGNGWLNNDERKAARESLKADGGFGGFGKGGFGKGGFGKGGGEPGKPGPRVTPADVKSFPKADLYEPTVLRTLFLDFENKDWEAELADFYRSDVEVPCTLTVDGKKYTNVGVHFRGMSSYFMVGEGRKRSLNLSLDFVEKKQRLYGYKTLNLLNSADDPSLMHTVLFSQVARTYIPSPKANFVKVVINGESWGVYVNAQQFNKDFLKENYGSGEGARWKVKGSPGGGGGLDYVGDNVEEYKRRYTLKSKEDPQAWKDLIHLCRTLDKTPLDKLEAALRPILDLDSVLWFLALDNALVNNDGYWVRGSDFSLYRDPKGKFHVIPHDTNETFSAGMGFGGKGGPKGGFDKKDFDKGDKKDFDKGKGGFGKGGFGKGGPGGGGITLDPLVGLNDTRKPLRSRLLSVPSLRAKYLENVRTIARDWLDWKKLGPVVAQYRALIEKEVEIDTRKLYSFTAFKSAVSDEPGAPMGGGGGFGKGGGLGLRAFADQRRNYLLNYPAIRELDARPAGAAPKGGEE